jgi:periplasmic protein TonB
VNLKIVLFFLLASSILHAQELIQTDYEKGYVKDGVRYSIWQYFNSKKEPELVINHSTGKVMFISKDTSNYVIFKNGQWMTSKLNIHPIPTTGFRNFYQAIIDTLKYPVKDFKNGLEGKVVITFDIDTLGSTTNYRIIKSIGGSCDSAVIASLKSKDQKWVPAMAEKKRYPSRFAIGFEFRLNKYQSPLEHEDFKVDPKYAKLLEEFVVKKPIDNNGGIKVFTFVERSAEPVGGLEAFYKWVGKNLRYPVNARNMGLEGKVFIKFVIEPDGSITNVLIVKGFNGECDKEAWRIISIMPKWSPGTQSGRPVRQQYTLPILFKVKE